MEQNTQWLLHLVHCLLQRSTCAQLDKEGLAIVFGVEYFYHYLLGYQFIIYSGHRPLQYLFSENEAISTVASAYIQCWVLTLSAYVYCLQVRQPA